jgi:predicted nucleotidyltransferase component of viral defense system
MKYRSATAFRAALEARLKDAQTDGVGISRLRKRVAFERLLARLQAVAPDAWVLKGGFALELRLGGSARTTKDIDIDWTLDEEDAIELLLDAAAAPLDDGFQYTLERSRADDDLVGGGQRWAVIATLAGREFERVAIDVGFGMAPVLAPETVSSSHLLDFVGVEPVRVRTAAIEQHVAEKLHAYTRTYAADKPSSRVKDLVDLVVIARTMTIEASNLVHALDEIFTRRTTHPLPEAVPAPPADWTSAWDMLVADLTVDADVRAGHEAASAFLDPVLAGTVRAGRWAPGLRAWNRP